jgi:tRNA nucleotidyltransferase/poly(A) polymerase
MAQIYKVGGCVRDRLLGIESKDIDFTFVCETSQTVEQGWSEMREWMTSRGFSIFLETPDCFTIRAKFPADHKFAGLVADFVMARKETGYIPGTRRPILELGTLEDDLIRRDFTVNAIAEDEDGNLIDPFGGVDDLLKDFMLKTPTDPMITMMDDPLRILRALRFSLTKALFIDKSIFAAMQQESILLKLEQTVSQERIREEISKMMKYDTVQTMRILVDIDDSMIPGFLRLVFKDNMWLKPTTEKR